MSLDPEVQAFLKELYASNPPPLDRISPAQLRENVAAEAAKMGPGEAVAEKRDCQLPDPDGPVPVRIYTPQGERVRGILVYFHGGGWVFGSVDTYDALCCTLANQAGCRVVSVDYCLAPEHKFPTAANDAFAATAWTFQHVREIAGNDSEPIAVGGDSAGGNLTAAVCLMARDRRAFRPAMQVLVYPAVNRDFGLPSYRENGEGYLLTTADVKWFWQQYLAHDEDACNPYACPWQAASLKDLPPALVITAGYDPLRDEGEAYAARLRDADVPVLLTRYPGMIHGFFGRLNQFAQARAAVRHVAETLRQYLR
jgi:acetyl esterase